MRRAGLILLGVAALLALLVGALVFTPALRLPARGPIGSTLAVDVPAERDWAVYSTLSTWRAADCTVVAADGQEIVLRPDMTQQRLRGIPTWFPQGSFEVERAQPVVVSCHGPEGEFAVGPSVGIGQLLVRLGLGLLALAAAVIGLILVITGGRSGRR